MAVFEPPENVENLRWEFRYESNEFERRDAQAVFRGKRVPARPYKALVGLIGWLLVIAIFLLILWVAALIAAFFEGQLLGGLNKDVGMLFNALIIVAVYGIVLWGIRASLSRRANLDKKKSLQGIVRIFGDHEVSFFDKDSMKKRKIENIYFSDRYVLLVIENGKRFIYLPMRVVDSSQLEALAKFAA